MRTQEEQREYQRKWVARRRAEWFADKACVDCGSIEELQLDHVDPALKVSHSIWSWSKARRDAETAKCVVRCRPCHVIKTVSNGEKARGERHGAATISSEVIASIRARAAAGERQVDICKDLGLDKRYVSAIVTRRSWKYE